MRNPLFAVLGLELLLLGTVPAEQLLALAAGEEVVLATRPVDPYDLLAGYYATLGYEIEDVPPALTPAELSEGERLWLTIERAEPAWRLVSVTRDRPAAAPDRATLRARWRHGRFELEQLKRFYVPEGQRHEATDAARGRGFVDARVGPGGAAALRRLRVGDRVFGA